MANVSFLPAADADYQAALTWYRARNTQVAARLEAAVADGVQRIADRPELYALVDGRHRRCLLRGYPYSLIYRVQPTGVLVVAVAHSRRSSYWRRRR
jgi:plasmid stabilization system protein ParE